MVDLLLLLLLQLRMGEGAYDLRCLFFHGYGYGYGHGVRMAFVHGLWMEWEWMALIIWSLCFSVLFCTALAAHPASRIRS